MYSWVTYIYALFAPPHIYNEVYNRPLGLKGLTKTFLYNVIIYQILELFKFFENVLHSPLNTV